MKLLLTSSGVSNPTIEAALVGLLGKPLAESTALVVATGIYPFDVGPTMAARLLRGEVGGPLVGLGWKEVGLLELSVLPSIGRDVWLGVLEAADALLVWGGDPLFLAHWLRESGVAEALPGLDVVYVGTSAGAMAATTVIGETYTEPRTAAGEALTSEELVFSSPEGDVDRTLVTARGGGFVDFSVIPHLDNPNHPDASRANAEVWASRIPAPTYAIDDGTAVLVTGGAVEVVSEGRWELFAPRPT